MSFQKLSVSKLYLIRNAKVAAFVELTSAPCEKMKQKKERATKLFVPHQTKKNACTCSTKYCTTSSTTPFLKWAIFCLVVSSAVWEVPWTPTYSQPDGASRPNPCSSWHLLPIEFDEFDGSLYIGMICLYLHRYYDFLWWRYVKVFARISRMHLHFVNT